MLGELKRRKVVRAALVYGAAAFAVLQVGDIVVDPLGLPSWFMSSLVWLAILGFPVTLVVAWFVDLTRSEDGSRRWISPRSAILVAILAAIGIIGFTLRPRSTRDGAPASPAAGIIDWGDVHAGDVAVDLMVAYEFLPASARATFFAEYGPVDAEVLGLARQRAAFDALSLTWYGYETGDEDVVHEGTPSGWASCSNGDSPEVVEDSRRNRLLRRGGDRPAGGRPALPLAGHERTRNDTLAKRVTRDGLHPASSRWTGRDAVILGYPVSPAVRDARHAFRRRGPGPCPDRRDSRADLGPRGKPVDR